MPLDVDVGEGPRNVDLVCPLHQGLPCVPGERFGFLGHLSTERASVDPGRAHEASNTQEIQGERTRVEGKSVTEMRLFLTPHPVWMLTCLATRMNVPVCQDTSTTSVRQAAP